MADLLTLANYKTYRGISGSSEDSQISAIIPGVSQIVKTYCGRTFIDYYSTTKTEYFDAAECFVVVSETPLVSVTSVKTSANGGITQTTLTEDSTDIDGYTVFIQEDKIVTQDSGPFLYESEYYTPVKSLEVVYNGGYADADSIPEDLKLALYDLVTYYLKEQHTLSKAIQATSIDNPGPVEGSGWPAHIKRILDMYKVA